MSIYIEFLIVIILEWFLLFPNANLVFGENITYNQKKLFLIIVCIEMIFFAGFRTTNIGADTPVYLDALEYYGAMPKSEILKAK